MCAADLVDQAVGAQYPQAAGDLATLAPQFRGISWGGAEQTRAKIAIAEASDDEFAAVDRRQELGIFPTQRIEATGAAPFPAPGLSTQAAHQFAEWRALVDRGEGVDVTIVRLLTHLRAPGHIDDA